MKTLERRNARVAKLEGSRKAIVKRNRINQARAGSIIRTCACGRVVKGNAYFMHAKVCVHAQNSNVEKP